MDFDLLIVGAGPGAVDLITLRGAAVSSLPTRR